MIAKAVIFDLDGVVSDTQKIHSRVESKLCAEYGIVITPEEITRRFSGVSVREMFPPLFKEAGLVCPALEELSQCKLDRFMQCADEIEEIPGAHDLINCLRGKKLPLAIASGSRLRAINLVLTTLGLLDKFDVITSSQEVEHGKPAPDVFLLAAHRLGVEPAACIVIEDGISGMLGAGAAGMRCVALVSDLRENYPADIIIKDLQEFPFSWFNL